MYRCFIGGVFILIVILQSCRPKKVDTSPHFSYNPQGYYYQLLAFEEESGLAAQGKIAWLSASFQTQSDSIFWDSFNSMNDKFYLQTDTNIIGNFLVNYVSHLSPFDSVCILIKPDAFYKQQFKSDSIPFFSRNDTVVKVYLKVKQVFSPSEFIRVKQNLLKNETRQIHKYFTTEAEANAAMDPLGFYWVAKEGEDKGKSIEVGNNVTIAYEGYFLNGRFLEKSEKNFELKFGTPDQLLKGLNFVIGGLKLGQNAKIILPSHLAFGEYGSSNGIVPPYTPLLYKIKIIDIKE